MQFGIAIKSLTIDKAKRSNLSMIDKHPTAYLCCQLKSEPLEGSTYSDISTLVPRLVPKSITGGSGVAQLVERSLQTSEVRESNPVINKI